MYNSEIKQEFVDAYAKDSRCLKKDAVRIFNVIEKYEAEWGADICTRSLAEIQPAVDDVAGLRKGTRYKSLTILREYGKWCKTMGVAGVRDDLANIEDAGYSKIKKQMVSSPLQLQKYLNELFSPEEEETLDNVYRCYHWLAYGGFLEEEILDIKCQDVDFVNMAVVYNEREMAIYREAIPAFRNAVNLNDFAYKHPNYNKVIRRNRVPGEELMRGIKASTKKYTIRTAISAAAKKAFNDGRTTKILSCQRLQMSGLFYRVYEQEYTGGEINFRDYAVEQVRGKTYSGKGMTVNQIVNKIERDLLEDYQRWKLAFAV